MPNRRAHDHLTDHNWQLEIDGVTVASFDSVEALSAGTATAPATHPPGLVPPVPPVPLASTGPVMMGRLKRGPGTGLRAFPALKGSDKIPAMDGSSKIPAMDGSSKIPALDGSSKIPTLKGSDKIPAMDGSSKIPALDSSSKMPLPQIRTANRLLIRGLVLDPANGHLLRHWVEPRGPRTASRGQIVMVDGKGNRLQRWNFFEAWPSKWKGSTAEGNATDVEVVVGRLSKA